jgi:YVTN family beta-propeller protein
MKLTIPSQKYARKSRTLAFMIILPPASLLALVLSAASPTPQPKNTLAPSTQNAALKPHPSPMDLALSSDGRRALTANSTANTVSLVDIAAGKVLAETSVGKRPFAVAFSPSGDKAAVTNFDSDTVTLLDVSPSAVKANAPIPVGDEPRGLAFSPDGKTLAVALSGENAVAIVNPLTKKVTARAGVGTEPWHLAFSPNGKRLAVGCTRAQEITVLDTTNWQELHTVKLRGRNVRHIAFAPDGHTVYVPHISERGRPATQENIDNGWVVGNRLSRVPITQEGPREAIALDPRGKAVGDLDGIAVSPDGNTIAVTAGGTHELLLMRLPLPFVAYGGPGDHIELNLLYDEKRFRRIPLGGRPLGVAFTPDGNTAIVANYLSDALQVVDVKEGKITRTIALGGPQTPSLTRRGEILFYDANRAFNQWYSCNTCHVEGHTGGGNFDTFNDGSYGTSKKTLSLRGVTDSGPWTWHGHQKDLRKLVRDSFTKSMQGPEPSAEELDAMMAFLTTLAVSPSPHRNADGSLSAAAKRGEAVFKAKGCDTCHTPPKYENAGTYPVGLESEMDAFPGFNPPSLRNVYSRAPYLHDGRARTLEDVLTKFHTPSKLNGKPDCTPAELTDLVAFLKAL